MPTILSQLEGAFREAIQAAFGIAADPILGPAQNEKFGDYQSNAAMGLAKQLSKKPREVAEAIKANLKLGEVASEVSIAGPGFINVRLNADWLAKQIKIIESDARLGVPLASSPQTVVVDYSGPNIAKQMHVGHLRSTIIGDAIARVIEFEGQTVVRQNHIGDWGTQFGMLITYVSQSIPDGKSPLAAVVVDGETKIPERLAISDLEQFYRSAKKCFDESESFQDEARRSVVGLQSGDTAALKTWKSIVDESRRHFLPVYRQLDVQLRESDERGESAYNDDLPAVVRDLKEKKVAVESEGATVVFVPGYENPLIIQKSDGGYLYGTTDLAAIRYRVRQLQANRVIYIHDSRQAQHFAQVFWTAKQASYTNGDQVKLEYAPFGTMLGEGGKPFKSRSGDTVKLKELLDEAEARALKLVSEKSPDLSEPDRKAIAHAVGIGAVKYADLSKERTSDYVFSFDKMLSMDGNTAPYLQYAHARVKSIFRKAQIDPASLKSAALKLESAHELAVAKHVLRFPEIVELLTRELKPHQLCTYLYDLATKFSGFYENCPVLQSEEPTRSSRLMLCGVTAKTMALGLDLLGIAHPEKM